MSTRAWYQYNDVQSGQFSPANYFYVTNLPVFCGLTGSNICAVLGIYVSSSVHPATFTARLNSYIVNALAFASAQPATGKIFVYVKNL